MNKRTRGADNARLMEIHRLHLGLYARVARKLSVNPSYVCRVAKGQRTNEKIMIILLKELRKLR